MIETRRENDYDIRYYDGYNKFTVPRVRGNQYNPMIVGEREELFNNILDSIDKKQSSPRYDHIFYVEGTNIDVGGGVEYPGMFNHADDDYTKVNIICELLDKNSGKTIDSFEKDLILDYSDFVDSYGIESDIEDYILDELRKYMVSKLEQNDPKYKKMEGKNTIKIRRNRKVNESDPMYFNGYTYDTVPDVPSIGGIPQYNLMIVEDRIELMDEVVKELEDYWYSEDPKLEDEITRVTSREEVLYIKDIYWKLENPDVVTVKFGLSGFYGSNDRLVETREIEINFENFLGRDIKGDLVMFLSKKIKSLLNSVLHGGLYKEGKNTIRIRRSRKFN